MKFSQPSHTRTVQFLTVVLVVGIVTVVLWHMSHQITTISESIGERRAGDAKDDVLATERELVQLLDESLRMVLGRAKQGVRQDNNNYVRFEARHHDNNKYTLVYIPSDKVLSYTVTGRESLKWSETYQGITLENIRYVAKKNGTLEMFKDLD